MIAIDKTNTVKPLKTVTVSTDEKNTVRVHDGQGRLYAEGTGPEFSFIVSGTLGHHAVAVLDTDGTELERSSFRVYCESGIEDESGQKISCGSDTIPATLMHPNGSTRPVTAAISEKSI